jgi:hypothetical protein
MSTRTQYYCATSLDGFIAEADDNLDWLTGYDGTFDGPGAEPMKGTYDRFYEDVGAMVTGSTTYQWVLNKVAEWPYAGKPVWVLTSRELPVPEGEGVDVRFARGDVREPRGLIRERPQQARMTMPERPSGFFSVLERPTGTRSFQSSRASFVSLPTL